LTAEGRDIAALKLALCYNHWAPASNRQGSYRSWKRLEKFGKNWEIFKALKSPENDHRYGKLWKNP